MTVCQYTILLRQKPHMDRWVEAINKDCLGNLSAHSNNYKYIVNTFLMEKAKGAGTQYDVSMFWDKETDYTLTVWWENETLHCIVTAFVVSL